MMVDVLRVAAEDAGAPSLLARAEMVRVVDLLSWGYRNAPALLAERVGATNVRPGQLIQSTVGGNSPQLLVNDAAAAIGAGQLDVVLIAGAETVYSRMLAGRAGHALDWTSQPAEVPPPERLGIDRPGTSDAESAHSLMLPTQVYPIFENALRAAAGESFDEHQAKIAGLWSRFSAVASTNPYAWSPEFRAPDEIATVTPDNRMIGFPYPKLMNANIQTDQAAALIVCSVAAARAAGVPEDRWVFPWAGADAHDHWFISDRESLSASPAIFACGQAVYDAAGVRAAAIAPVGGN